MALVGSIVPRNHVRALDVAGGDGRLALNLLFRSYAKVDLFDQCPEAVKRAKQAMRDHPRCGYVSKATMQSFKWEFSYSAIFMVWCVGYLGRPELISFLKKA